MMGFVSIVILSGIISTVIFATILYRGFSSPIVLKHDLNPHGWFGVHTMTYFLTIMMSLIIDLISISMSSITNMPMSLAGIGILFIQSGGLIILVMIISSVIYNYFIKSIKFHYFVSHHQWIKKVFFTIVCVSLAIMYSVEAIKTPNEVNILGEEYKLITFWIITILQIWIGFGMNLRFSRLGAMDFLSNLKCRIRKTVRDLKDKKEESQYIIICLVSMLVFPVLVPLFICFADKIPKVWENVVFAWYMGIMIGSLISLVVSIGMLLIHTKSRWWSDKRFYKVFRVADCRVKVRYYRGVKYQLRKNEMGYIFSICEEIIKCSKEDGFSEEYLERVKALSQESEEKVFLFEEYEEKEIRELIHNKLVEFSIMRENILKEGWDTVYKLVDEKAKNL